MIRIPHLLACVALIAAFALSPSTFAQSTGRRVLAADYSTKRIAIIGADGKTEWEHKIGDLHDLHMLPNGNILMQIGWTRIVEIDPRKQAPANIVWEYDSAKMNGNEGKRVECHAFQRLPDGLTMIAESGVSRIIEVDKDGRIHRELKLNVKNPHPHRDTRLARKLDNGRYLVAHEGEGVVREYDSAGKTVWEFAVPLFGKQPKGGHGLEAFGNACFAAIRLKNGNTLISTGNGHSVIEVNPAKEIVWKVEQNDVPGVQLAWVTTLQQLPNGNLIIGNCHAGPNNPQIIEITREKKLVWSFKDFQRFGDALANSEVLDIEGDVR